MILNREDSCVPRPFVQVYPPNQAKLFLCTTMYREDPKIMSHYLKCLSRLGNINRKYSSIETHIVMDDAFAVSKSSLNSHAKCFVDLCKEILNNSIMTEEIKMPYGSQILVTMEDGMLVYLHFKDSLKVNISKST